MRSYPKRNSFGISDAIDVKYEGLLTRSQNSWKKKSSPKKGFQNSAEIEYIDVNEEKDNVDKVRSNISSDEDDFVLQISEDSCKYILQLIELQ